MLVVPMAQHPGLRLSLASFVFFAFGLVSLLFLPSAIALAITLAGGLGVWSGFLWTLFSWYGQPHPPDD